MDLAEAYLDHLRVERRVADHTLTSYAHDLVLLGRFAAGRERDVASLERPELEQFVRDLMAAGR